MYCIYSIYYILYIIYYIYIYVFYIYICIGSLLSFYVTLTYQPTIDDMLSHINIISRITLIGKDYNISPLIINLAILPIIQGEAPHVCCFITFYNPHSIPLLIKRGLLENPSMIFPARNLHLVRGFPQLASFDSWRVYPSQSTQRS